MTQVKIKIEEFFGAPRAKIVWEVEGEFSDLKHEAMDIICSKADFVNGSFSILKPDESRETILRALFELQNSKLPESGRYEMFKVLSGIGAEKYIKNSKKPEKLIDNILIIYDYENDIEIDFYDPETRIITITKFEED